MELKGIDVSTHDGKIDWNKAKNSVDFVIIRAGYGKNNIDNKAVYNVTECIKHKNPFGLYWFSYALNKQMAINEANFLCDFADKYKPQYPLCYDWEYDSDEYAKKSKIVLNNEARKEFAVAFLDTVKKRGYTPMLYTNLDYLNKGFNSLLNKYDIWLAQWGVKAPSKTCDIWQNASTANIPGIKVKVDTNICYKNYINTTNNNAKPVNDIEKTNAKNDELKKAENDFWNKYLTIANDVISGKYGNGTVRKVKIKNLGYDYTVVQTIVNILLK